MLTGFVKGLDRSLRHGESPVAAVPAAPALQEALAVRTTTGSTPVVDDAPAVAWEPPSWEEIVRDHSARVYRLSYRLTGNAHDAEDLTQDVFVRVFRSLHRFQPGTFEGWLHRITTNLFLDGARRRQKIRFDGLAEGSDDRLASSWPNPSQQLDDADLDHDVAAALNALAPTFRAAVVLCDIEGLTYEEISEVLDLKIGTVRSRIHRGRAQLRAALAHRRPTLEHTRYLGVDAEPGRSTTDDDAGVGGRVHAVAP
ncbi:RNA polymerase sigma factor SigE [Microlunatus antarcticus]